MCLARPGWTMRPVAKRVYGPLRLLGFLPLPAGFIHCGRPRKAD